MTSVCCLTHVVRRTVPHGWKRKNSASCRWMALPLMLETMPAGGDLQEALRNPHRPHDANSQLRKCERAPGRVAVTNISAVEMRFLLCLKMTGLRVMP